MTKSAKCVERIGSRAQVFHGNARQTSGGLTCKHLIMNKHGRIVSRKLSKLAGNGKRLRDAGYTTVKGKFGAVKTEGGSTRKHRKGHRGGATTLPMPLDGNNDFDPNDINHSKTMSAGGRKKTHRNKSRKVRGG